MKKNFLIITILYIIFFIFPTIVMADDYYTYRDVLSCDSIYHTTAQFSGTFEWKIYNGKKACLIKYNSNIDDSIFLEALTTTKIECPSGFDKYSIDFESGGFRYVGEGCRKAGLDYEGEICANGGIRKVVRIIGNIIQVAKWIIPFIIIILGMLDFGKAIVSNDEKATSKALSALVRRIVAGVVIFFIPTIILAILNAIDVTKGIEDKENSQFGLCTRCLFDPSSEECQ